MNSIQVIGNVFPKGNYRRIISLGLRNQEPKLTDFIDNNVNSNQTIQKELISPSFITNENIKNMFPTLLVWENSCLERFYAEVI